MRSFCLLLTLLFFPLAQVAGAAPTEVCSAAALFNRGNECARAHKTAMAILYYERAQLLAPNNKDIAANLHFVRSRAGLPDLAESWVASSFTFLSANTMAWLGSLGLVLAGISLFFRQPGFKALTIAGALLFGTAVGSAIARCPKINSAVVMVRDAIVRTSPAAAAESIFKLREGDTVTVLAVHRHFALVQTSTGHSGWIVRDNISRISTL